MAANSESESCATLGPLRKYSPDVGVSRQPMMFMSVDFPDPEGPINATYSFFLMVRLIPLRARTVSSPMV